jgi:hypothetical protein
MKPEIFVPKSPYAHNDLFRVRASSSNTLAIHDEAAL